MEINEPPEDFLFLILRACSVSFSTELSRLDIEHPGHV